MRKVTKILTCISIAANLFISGSMCTGINAFAVTNDEYSTIIPPIPQEELDKIYSEFSEETMPISMQTTRSLPSAVDLSTSPYFPPIGDQGNYGTCVAWATTYYQFTYAANKLNNIVSTESTAYSPSWIYNWLNNGIANATSGLEKTSVYKMLSTRGCLTMADCPYYKPNGEYNNSIQNDTKKMVDALKTRITSYQTIYIRTADTSISSPYDSRLNYIKELLNDGYILQSNTRYNFDTKTTTSNEEAVCACYDTSLGHGLTIVGYNDNIRCDINNDGIISDGEKGALKIADSHGVNVHNNGFFWLMYDALNKSSSYSNNQNRVAAFSYGVREKGVNFFSYIEVENKPVNVVALLGINTNCINNFDFETTKSTANPYYDEQTQVYSTFTGSFPKSTDIMAGLVPYNGVIPLDYGELDDPASVLINNSICFLGVRLNMRRNDIISNSSITSFQLCDSNMNIVTGTTSVPSIQNGEWFDSVYAKFSKGDLNYNRQIDAEDSNMLLEYLVEARDFSNFQLYLADLNNDGTVSLADLNALNNNLPKSEFSKFIIASKSLYKNMSIDEKKEYETIFVEIGSDFE